MIPARHRVKLGLAVALAAVALTCPAHAAWMWSKDNLNLPDTGWNWPYGSATGPATAFEINTTVGLTNFVGQPLVGMMFSIQPHAGETYEAGEFEAIVFDVVADTTEDVAPFVPPSATIALAGATLSPDSQSLTCLFSGTMAPFALETFKFQIERPDSAPLFDIRISPIVPEPATVLLALLGMLLPARRRPRTA